MKLVFKVEGFGKKSEHEISVNETLSIGRTEDTNIKLQDPKVSTKHCIIELKTNAFTVQDTGSKNGTYLNGVKIIHAKFYVGDELKIGDYKITIVPEKTDPNLHSMLKGADTSKAHSPRLTVDDHRSQKQIINPIKKITANTKELLTKSEILQQNKFLHLKSIIVSILIFGGVGYCTFISVPFFHPGKALHTLILSEIISLGTLYYFGFKKPEFTIAEKIVGIQKKYENQNL